MSSHGNFLFVHCTVPFLVSHLHIDSLADECEDEHQLTAGVETPRRVLSTAVNHQVINPRENSALRDVLHAEFVGRPRGVCGPATHLHYSGELSA